MLLTICLTALAGPIDSAIGWTRMDILRYISIPIVSVGFTYVHIWLALWMTFYPVKFWGLWQLPGTNVGLGWQGIIPFKAEKMARKAVQLMTTQLIKVEEVFARLEPQQVVYTLRPVIYHLMTSTVGEVANMLAPGVWDRLPKRVKDEVTASALEEAPVVVEKFMLEVRERIHEVLDLEEMVVRQLTADKNLLIEMFIQCGDKELEFIRNSGAWMGGLFGLVQLAVWLIYPLPLFLPLFGLVVGALTNWIALFIIFRPVEPIRCGRCCTFQGLFLKRQAQVSAEYARVVSSKVLTPRILLENLVSSPIAAQRLTEMAARHVQHGVDQVTSGASKLVKLTMGGRQYKAVIDFMLRRMAEAIPTSLQFLEPYAQAAMDLEKTLREKMMSLPPAEFEALLHPVFEEDEWKLILMGGVLGAVIGVIQIYTLE